MVGMFRRGDDVTGVGQPLGEVAGLRGAAPEAVREQDQGRRRDGIGQPDQAAPPLEDGAPFVRRGSGGKRGEH
jgi:hypothetical protein